MYEKQSYAVNRLKDFLIEGYYPEVIILYGSTARGDIDEFSDIDMMVIMDVDDSEKVSAEMLAQSDHIVHDKHIMLRSCNDYYNHKDIPGTMVHSALSEGVILFNRPGFDMDAMPLKGYEERKRDVIENEYIGQAKGFFENAERALERRQLFRCRDYLRFAAVRILKAVLVFRDVHPPRSSDLEKLYGIAKELLPEIKTLHRIILELYEYLPGENNPEEVARCKETIDNVSFIIGRITSLIC